MTPEAEDFLLKAKWKLDEAQRIVPAAAHGLVAREAYLVAFLAAEALIAERTNKAAKTHAGVQSEFHRLCRTEPDIDQRFPHFLSKSFELKSNADYAVGREFRDVSEAEALGALQTARELVASVEAAIMAAPGVRAL